MDISPELIYAAVAGLAAAVAWQARQATANHKACEEHNRKLDDRVTALSDHTNDLLVGVIRENSESNQAVVEYLRKLRNAVNNGNDVDTDSSLLTSIRDGFEYTPLERREDGTTVIIKRKI